MLGILVTAGVVLYLFTKAVFARPPAKSAEEQLGETLTKYLSQGVKVRLEKDDRG